MKITFEKMGERFHYSTGDYRDMFTIAADGKKVQGGDLHKNTDFRKSGKIVTYNLKWLENWDKWNNGNIIRVCKTLNEAKKYVADMVARGGELAYNCYWAKH